MINLNKVVSHGVLALSPSSYIGKVGDLTVDSNVAQIYWHDGVTPGGVPLISGAQSNVFSGSITVGNPSGLPSTGDVNINGFYKTNDVIVAGGGTGSANAVAGVIPGGTLNRQYGIITTEALSAASTYVLTMNNSVVVHTSVVQVTFRSATESGAWVTSVVCTGNGPTNGQMVISIAFPSPFTGTLQIVYAVFN